MGLLKWIMKKFSCKSDCQYNSSDFDTNELCSVDFSKYVLKTSDLIRLQKIIMKRPSSTIHYKDEEPTSISKITEITEV